MKLRNLLRIKLIGDFLFLGLDTLRSLTATVDPALFLLSLFLTGISIILVGKFTQSSVKQSASAQSSAKQTQKRKK